MPPPGGRRRGVAAENGHRHHGCVGAWSECVSSCRCISREKSPLAFFTGAIQGGLCPSLRFDWRSLLSLFTAKVSEGSRHSVTCGCLTFGARFRQARLRLAHLESRDTGDSCGFLIHKSAPDHNFLLGDFLMRLTAESPKLDSLSFRKCRDKVALRDIAFKSCVHVRPRFW